MNTKIDLSDPENTLQLDIFSRALSPSSGFDHELPLSRYVLTVKTKEYLKLVSFGCRGDDWDEGAFERFEGEWFEAVDVVRIPDGAHVLSGDAAVEWSPGDCVVVWEPVPVERTKL